MPNSWAGFGTLDIHVDCVDRAHRDWALLLVVIVVPGALVGWFLGRRWARCAETAESPRRQRLWLCVAGATVFGGMANCAWLFLIWQVWQSAGPFRGFAILGGWLQAIAVATAVSVLASLIAGN